MLAIAGLIVTAGGIVGLVLYLHICVGARPGSLDATFCQIQPVLPGSMLWLVVGLILDAGAVAAVRFRTRPWLRQALKSRPVAR